MNIVEAEARKRKINNVEIAEFLGVSSTSITYYFSGENQMSYLKFIKLIYFIYGEYNRELIKRFCILSKKNVDLPLLEWAYAIGDEEILSVLLRKRNTNKDSVFLYTLLLKRMQCEIKPLDLYKKIRGHKFDSKKIEIELLTQTCMIYALIDMAAYGAIQHLAMDALEQANKIKDEDTRKSFKLRLKVLLAAGYLKNNEQQRAKQLTLNIVKDDLNKIRFPMYYNIALVYLGELYVFNDYRKSINYIKESLKMVEEGIIKNSPHRIKILKSTHDFIKIHYKDYEGLFLEDPAEQAHYYASLNTDKSRIKAVKILNELFSQNNELTNFQMYYQALALNNIDMMKRVMKAFYKSGDCYYSSLPEAWIEKNEKYYK